MRTSMLCLGALAVVGGACALFGEDGGPGDAASLLVGRTWEQVAIFDTYDGVWHPHDGSGALHVYTFHEAGTFVEDWQGGCCRHVGTWALMKDTLVLHYTDHSNRDLDVELRTVSEGELQLAFMGRHGPVIYKFLPASRP